LYAIADEANFTFALKAAKRIDAVGKAMAVVILGFAFVTVSTSLSVTTKIDKVFGWGTAFAFEGT
jgi:hypothetical protein